MLDQSASATRAQAPIASVHGHALVKNVQACEHGRTCAHTPTNTNAHTRTHPLKYTPTRANTHTHTHARASCANAFASALSHACTTQPAHFHFNPASRHSAALTPASANAHHNHTTRSLATAPTRTTPRPRFSNLLPHKHAHLGAKTPRRLL